MIVVYPGYERQKRGKNRHLDFLGGIHIWENKARNSGNAEVLCFLHCVQQVETIGFPKDKQFFNERLKRFSSNC